MLSRFWVVPASDDIIAWKDKGTDLDADKFLKENEVCQLVLYGDEVIGLELPLTVVLEVAQTDPGLKGDTASGATKPATTDTGLVVQVPLFVNEGERIKVNTDTGEYIERVAG